ncbi:unnamed protein product [Nippostrongylus brasiliensis]|uniref:MSP domain-containing protein n=1 Tax=Nippostrongylus brasiliensis TaxID=27835 RepID=A0A0N4XPG1_NIPBR|nr:unnamed protein product [Nippostrongylus brasiliensis]
MLPFVCKVSFTPRTQLPPSPFPFPGLFLSPFDQRPNLHVQQPHWLINIQVPLPPIRAKPLTVQLKNGERIPVAKCDIYEPKYKSSLPGLHNIAICNSTSGKEIVLTNIVFTHGQLREQTSIDAFFMSCPIRRDQLRKSSRNGYEITRSSKQKRFYLKGGTAGDIPLDIFAYPTRSNGRKEVTVTEFVQESHSVSTSKVTFTASSTSPAFEKVKTGDAYDN